MDGSLITERTAEAQGGAVRLGRVVASNGSQAVIVLESAEPARSIPACRSAPW